MSGKDFPKRGEIYWTDLEPVRGGEIQKIRPALIVSNDIGNELSQVVMIAPITSKASRIFPFEVKIILNGKQGKIVLNQCRAVDKSRLLNKIDLVDSQTMNEVVNAIKVVFGIP